MNINVQAFEIALGRGITMSQFYDYIIEFNNSVVDDRYLYISRSNGWWKGLLLTAKNIKAFSRMQRMGPHITLSPENLDDSELAHFNYFILHEERKRGLFQHYHGAATMNGFGFQLKHRYNTLKQEMISQACARAGESAESPPVRIKRQYSGSLSYEIVLRRTSFESLVQELRKVKNVTVQFKEYSPNARPFRTLASKASAVRHRLTFRNQYSGSIKDDLIELSRFSGLKDLSGVGIDRNDFEHRFKLLNEPETLGIFDFNEIVLETQFDSNRIPESIETAPMIEKLEEIASEDAWCMGRL